MLLRLMRIRNNHLILLFNIIVGMLESALLLWQVACVKDIIDAVARKNQDSLISGFLLLAVAILATIMARLFCSYTRSLFKIRFRNDISVCLFENYLSSEYLGKEDLHSGDVMSRIVQDIDNVTSFIASTLPQIVSNACLLAGAFIYLCFIYWPLALCVVFISPLFLLLGRRYLRRMDNYSLELRQSETKAQTLFQEIVQNRLVIKVNRVVGYVRKRYETHASNIERVTVRQARCSAWMDFLMMIGFNVCYIITLGWGGWLLFEDIITFGAMAALLQLTDNIQRPAQTLAGTVPMWAAFSVARRRLADIAAKSHHAKTLCTLQPPLGIKFQSICFGYDNKEGEVLKDFSFFFKPGSFTVVRGKSGAGKTTMLNLILAVYKPLKGIVFVCDRDSEIPVSSEITDYIEYVPQGNNVLSGTVEENLRLGKPDAGISEMEDALRMACADFVFNSPEGLNASCGENGVGFSEGQAQRIVIARALLRQRPILILDEATSALDYQTENQLLENLKNIPQKTIIFVTHKTHVEHIGDTILNL